MRLTGGAEHDMRERTYQEVVTTRETTLWGKVAAQPTEKLSTWLKYAYSWRDNSVYGTSVWFGYAENPLLRKFNLADRQRNRHRGAGRLRDQREDLVRHLGRLGGRRLRRLDGRPRLGPEREPRRRARGSLHGTNPGPRVRPDPVDPFAAERQRGVRRARLDRRVKDKFDVLGLGVKHVAIPDKLDIGADLTISRSRSDVAVDNALAAPPFPTARTKLDAIKLYGVYNLKDNLSIAGSYHYEHYGSERTGASRASARRPSPTCSLSARSRRTIR